MRTNNQPKKETPNMAPTNTAGALTPAQLERRLAQAFDVVGATLDRTTPAFRHPDHKAARATWRAHRTAHGFKTAGDLLSEDIGKTQKNDVRTYALAFLPASTSGIANTCAWEDKCSGPCVAFSGKGAMDDVMRSRLCRLAFAVEHPLEFAWLLTAELDEIHLDAVREWQPRADRKPLRLVRLNAYSDIRWERVAPWLFDRCSAIGFYDYTKHPLRSRPVDTMPANYRLTYSVSSRSTLDEVTAAAYAGRNPAVVFSARANSNHDALPETWAGLEVLDGDETDDRYNDPRNVRDHRQTSGTRPVVVGLRRKGSLSAAGELVRAGEKIARAHAREFGA